MFDGKTAWGGVGQGPKVREMIGGEEIEEGGVLSTKERESLGFFGEEQV